MLFRSRASSFVEPKRYGREAGAVSVAVVSFVPKSSPSFRSALAPRSNAEEGMDKYHSNTRFAPLRDAPFALRGAFGTSNSSFNNMDGLRHSSSIGQARSYTSSPLGALRQKIPPSGNRSLHTSRPLSAPVANRPLSPHLPLKKPQLSATFSISHRIFGVALGAAIISIPLATRFGVMFEV